MIALCRLIAKLLFSALLFPLRLFPVRKNRIVLLSNILSPDSVYSCSPKYIAEYLLKNRPGCYEIIFPLGKKRDPTALRKKGLTPVVLGSLKYYYYVLTAQVFVTTSQAITYIPFRRSQVIINTWHGGGAYKKSGAISMGSKAYKKDCEIASGRTRYFVSSSRKFTECIGPDLLIDEKKFLPIGLPRNDIFFTDYQERVSELKAHYGIPAQTKVILYAPTYRTVGNRFAKHQIGPYEIDFERTVQAFTERFGGEWVFAVRLHPSIAASITEMPEGVVNLSAHPDPQEVLCAADVLINDYSSIMWDFVQTRRPCFIFAPDYNEYEDNIGLYTPPSSWPFPFSTSNEQLRENIDKFDEADYAAQVQHYFDWMGNYETGTACARLTEVIDHACGVKD